MSIEGFETAVEQARALCNALGTSDAQVSITPKKGKRKMGYEVIVHSASDPRKSLSGFVGQRDFVPAPSPLAGKPRGKGKATAAATAN